MSRVAARKPATYEDLLKVPDHLVAEILRGELFATPRPSMPHAVAASALHGPLSTRFQYGEGGPGGWWILFEPELHLGAEIAVPDIAGWRRERLPVVPDAPFMTMAPDWVCEVISPSTEKLDRVLKVDTYARAGVAHLWFLNPRAESLEILRLEGGRWVVVTAFAGDAVVRAEPFDAIELELFRLWGRDQPLEHS